MAWELLPLPRHQPVGLKPGLRKHRGALGALLLSCRADFTSLIPNSRKRPALIPHLGCALGGERGRGKGGGADLVSVRGIRPFTCSPGVTISSGILQSPAARLAHLGAGRESCVESHPGLKGRGPLAARPRESPVPEFPRG